MRETRPFRRDRHDQRRHAARCVRELPPDQADATSYNQRRCRRPAALRRRGCRRSGQLLSPYRGRRRNGEAVRAREWLRGGKRTATHSDARQQTSYRADRMELPFECDRHCHLIGGGHDVIGWRAPWQAFLGVPPRGPASAPAIVDRFADASDRARLVRLPSDRPP